MQPPAILGAYQYDFIVLMCHLLRCLVPSRQSERTVRLLSRPRRQSGRAVDVSAEQRQRIRQPGRAPRMFRNHCSASSLLASVIVDVHVIEPHMLYPLFRRQSVVRIVRITYLKYYNQCPPAKLRRPHCFVSNKMPNIELGFKTYLL